VQALIYEKRRNRTVTRHRTAVQAKSMTRLERRLIHRRRLPIYFALACMPPLSHWPRKPEPYRDKDSDVLKFIRDFGVDLAEAIKIFHCAGMGVQRLGLIVFDRNTALWSGTHDVSRLHIESEVQAGKCPLQHEFDVRVSQGYSCT
jgi:hypothetical protein